MYKFYKHNITAYYRDKGACLAFIFPNISNGKLYPRFLCFPIKSHQSLGNFPRLMVLET